jgi:hypothetical protein
MLEPPIIDVEASGFDGRSYPIEVGVVLSSGKRYSSLIRPVAQWTHWDDYAEKVHHVSRDTLFEHGKEVGEVALSLNRLLSGMTVFTDGWVVDKPWLDELFFQAAVPMEFFVSPLELILSERQMELWGETKSQVLINSELERHRASSDAWMIQQIYKKTALAARQ